MLINELYCCCIVHRTRQAVAPCFQTLCYANKRLGVTSYLMDRYKGGINPLLCHSARKRISSFPEMCNYAFKEWVLYFLAVKPTSSQYEPWLTGYLFIYWNSFRRRDLGVLTAATPLLSLTKHPMYYLSTLQGVFNQPEWSPQLAFKANLCITKGWDV